jgi:hypothetical protein
MKVPRIVLALSVLAWAGFGAWLYVFPERLDGVGLAPDGGLGRTEVRAFYGGLELGIAAFLGWCLAAASRTRVGLMAATMVVGCTGLGRLSGIALEGFETTPLMWTFVAIELTAAALSAWAIRWTSPAPRTPDPAT